MEGWAEYRTSAHALSDIKYHIVWITKYLYKVLRGDVARRARDLIRTDLRVEGTEDYSRSSIAGPHPHPGSGTSASGAVENRAILKGRSSRRAAGGISPVAEAVLGSASLGAGIFLRGRWARWTKKTIMAYIENQKWDEDDQGFKITASSEALSRLSAGNASDGFSRTHRLSVAAQPTSFSW